MTKKEIDETGVIVTTPEKWDVVTRKGAGSGDGEVAEVRLLSSFSAEFDTPPFPAYRRLTPTLPPSSRKSSSSSSTKSTSFTKIVAPFSRPSSPVLFAKSSPRSHSFVLSVSLRRCRTTSMLLTSSGESTLP
jgi:hypothetical protein